jgi:hypothetical protein
MQIKFRMSPTKNPYTVSGGAAIASGRLPKRNAFQGPALAKHSDANARQRLLIAICSPSSDNLFLESPSRRAGSNEQSKTGDDADTGRSVFRKDHAGSEDATALSG